MIVPVLSATTKRNSRSIAGTSSAITRICPSSTPTLKDTREVRRGDPANGSVSRRANEKPKPWTRPKPNAIIHRRLTLVGPHVPSLALGPHPQRELTLMPRLGFPVLGSAWPQALASSLALGPDPQTAALPGAATLPTIFSTAI